MKNYIAILHFIKITIINNCYNILYLKKNIDFSVNGGITPFINRVFIGENNAYFREAR